MTRKKSSSSPLPQTEDDLVPGKQSGDQASNDSDEDNLVIDTGSVRRVQRVLDLLFGSGRDLIVFSYWGLHTER